MSDINIMPHPVPPKAERSQDVPADKPSPMPERRHKFARALKLAGLSLLVIYGSGVVFSHFAYSADDRRACYEAGGFNGYFWCPDWVEIEGYHKHFTNALIWPIYGFASPSAKIETVKTRAVAAPRNNGAEILKQRQAARQAAISEAQGLLNSLGYKVGVPDGVIGQRTHDAISDFQLHDGMQVSGLVSAELIARLKNSVRARQSSKADQQ